MLTRDIKCMLLWAALAIVLLSQTSSAITVLYEAEDAVADENGPYFSTTISNYSGTGSMVFGSATADGTGLNFSVTARDAGNYFLTIRFSSPYGDKPNELWVNGVKIATISFDQTPYVWEDYAFGNISLNEGDNVVRIQENWGYMYVDYITLGGFPATATDPIPANHDTVSVNLPQLCWTNVDPNFPGDIITSDVYFGTTVPDRNQSDYGLTQIADGIEETCVDIPPSMLDLDPFETYYWVVDCWDPNDGNPYVMRGYSWDFDTNNSAPEVDAGPDQYVGLGNDGDPESATVTLDGSGTTDDGLPSGTLNYVWQQLSGPAGVVIYPYDTSITAVNLSATGAYEFSLTAGDSLLEDTDTVVITVYESQCEVYKAQGGTLDLGDITENCVVDIEDLVAFTWFWLECNSVGPCVE